MADKTITTPAQLLEEWIGMISRAERCYYPNGIGYRISFSEGQLAHAHKVLEADRCKPDPLGEALNSGDGVYRP